MNAKIAVATALSSSISSSEVRTLNGCLITAYSVLQPFGWSSIPLINEKATLALSGGVCLTICPSKSSTEDFVGRSSNGRYRRIVISGFNDITDTLSEHRTGQRRSVRNGSLGGIGSSPTIHSEAEIETLITLLGREPGGLVVMPDTFVESHRTQTILLAARNNVLTVYPESVWARDGGLLSYGPNRADIFRRSAAYVDRILRGAKPADLPVQAPTKYELVINLKTAKALDLAVPPTLLARADEVIE